MTAGAEPAGAAVLRRLPATAQRTSRAPIGRLAFLGVVVASFGGPLALAALYAPTIITDTTSTAGLVAVSAAVVFAVPLVVWVRYARHVASDGGLYGFVREAAGSRVASVQAALWIVSYALYLVYTTASIVYETLPAVLPWVHRYQSLLEVAIPVALAGVLLAGRTATLAVIGVLAGGQLILVGILAGVAISHDAPVHAFAGSAPAGEFAKATGQISLLYVCGSLPVYLGGEVVRPTRTIPRGLVAGYLLTAIGVAAAVFPIAANPAFTRAPIPGMSIAEVFAGHQLAVAIGVGVAASVVGVMFVEALALSRLLHVLSRRSVRATTAFVAAVLVVSAPLTLISPKRIYDDLLKPSLVALWLSQLIVFAVYPAFARRRGNRLGVALAVAAGGVVFAGYGLVATFQHSGT
ncbi:MAG TPA: hypothetical protein VKB75_00860 [Jatrophihabitans sp.]|nr:hypothetical protein [Jatrophihabitans sp.]